MVDRLLILNRLRWYVRLPAKWLILGLTLLAVCFPDPDLLVRHIRHWSNPNALIEPNAACLQPFVDELSPRMGDPASPQEALKLVERYVREKIKYEWDWDNWGTADYMPTLAEAIERGHEDCDGRAVVAASLLARFGFQAQIVTDFSHVWVKTEHGETMGPGKRKAVVAGKQGLKLQAAALVELPKALAYGTAVFPLARELIIIAVAWWLMLRRGGGFTCGVVGLGLLLCGVFLLRAGGQDYWKPVAWMQWTGGATLVGSLASLLVWARANARRTHRRP